MEIDAHFSGWNSGGREALLGTQQPLEQGHHRGSRRQLPGRVYQLLGQISPKEVVLREDATEAQEIEEEVRPRQYVRPSQGHCREELRRK